MYIRIFTEKEKQFIREKYVNTKWTVAKIGKAEKDKKNKYFSCKY